MENDAINIGPDTRIDPDNLLILAISHPERALTLAVAVLNEPAGSERLSAAHQALAIVERDRGRLDPALDHARRALNHARRVDQQRTADVMATLGATLVYAGHTQRGLRYLETAAVQAKGDIRTRVLHRRAHLLTLVGRYAEAVADLDAAVTASETTGDDLWLGRSLVNRSDANLALGATRSAESDAVRAEKILSSLQRPLEAAQALHNQAIAAHQRGDLPRALALLDDVARGYQQLGVFRADLAIDRARTLLTAGLMSEAMATVGSALAAKDLQPVKRAEILLTAAQAALADGDIDAAEVDADLAGQLFAAQERPTWAHRARLLSLQAQYLADHPDKRDLTLQPTDRGTQDAEQRRRQRRLLRSTAELVAQMRDERAVELPVALLLHGRIAHDADRDDEARASYTEAARSRHTAYGLGRAAGWLAVALLADLTDDRRALLHACRRGLDAVDEYRALLGDLELRALATRHGNELATMALRSAERRGDARSMLWWIERWRATALAVPRTRPARDQELDQHVAALRDVVRRLDSADGSTGDSLRQERDRLEAQVRRTRRRQPADGARAAAFDLTAIREELGEIVLLVLLTVDGQLSALTVADGRVRRRPVGTLADALREARFTRFALRRTAFGRVADIPAAAARLQRALLGDTARAWSRPRIVVVPTADLLTAPWGVLPVFAESVVTIAPSATLWSQARRRHDRHGHIALVTGPDLSSGEQEVTALSPLHDSARAVGGERATVAGALAVLEGARLAHIAAHGTFRADAPMFSSLKLHDGPLTIHDLDRLDRPPAEMVLSACDSGNAAPIGAHEALGLVSSLLAMGTSSVLASVVPVNDQATVGVMRNVHDVVGRGGSLAEGWLAARQAATDPLERATAGAFTAWGA